ncbi:hypothetical protein BDV41DRAFT_576634 [Aspergillus transmontanensis]|uniref:BTB domain-containing protein n=1 Tax=Aspergillus transmontanensis TaxID=1034304 RepID=A0A5N6VZ98_9EURO|nr:hypothetical protein BDV41DRAFT_576634 [Aspergillus transmontanensis]
MKSTNETSNDQVLLHISDRQFITCKSTLSQKSTFFEALFSTRWNNQRPDGSYFIDADPNLFEHILPAPGSKFGIDGLREWLEEEKYLQAVKIERSVKVLDILKAEGLETRLANAEEQYFPNWGTRHVFGHEEAIYEDEPALTGMVVLDWDGGCGE